MGYIYGAIAVSIIFLGVLIYVIKANKIQLWIIFFILLLIVNALFVSWAQYQSSGYMGAMAFFVIFPMALPLAIIDFIAVFFYFRKQHYKGIIAKDISYTVFIAVSFVLTFVAWYVILIWLHGHMDIDTLIFIESPPFLLVIPIVATILLTILFHHHQNSRKQTPVPPNPNLPRLD